jgi:hypothetical protein
MGEPHCCGQFPESGGVLKQWEIFTFDFVPEGAHPVVIISSNARVRLKDRVNVLICSSQRAGRPPRETEIVLDVADGLDWPTLCKCDLSYLVPKAELYHQRGIVAQARRRAIVNGLIQSFEFNAL